MFKADLLANKRILVTGGGSGLGAAMGRRFLELGAELVICGRRADVLSATAEQLSSETGGSVTPLRCDLRDPEAVEAMMSEIWQAGPLDILVNNAAGNFIARTETLSHRAVDSVLGIVLHGSAYCTIAAGRRWIEAGKRGNVVLSILTLSALRGAAFRVPSAMAKAGVHAMTKSLAAEWGPKGIRTAAIVPGWFPTDGASQRLRPTDDARPVTADIPLGRAGEHAELANLAAFLVSDGAGYINGECVAIDGGRQFIGDGGGNTATLLGWGDAEWAAMRRQAKGE
ncbi:MAG TPA: SDR family oxidoreductase [Hyphomicrobiaceae bacterium]|nr:SDR family oxidoreductase [Hyphomicrobiaceae bacterium]